MYVRETGGPGDKDPERFTAENVSFQNLVEDAWDLKPYQIAGPEWMAMTRFMVTAKVPAGATREQFRVMLRNLLAERFALTVHWDTKELPIYEMVVAKGGPKLKESAPEQPQPETDGQKPAERLKAGADGFPVLPEGGETTMAIMRGKAARRARREST